MSSLTNILSWIIFGSTIAGLAYIFEPRLRHPTSFILAIVGATGAGLLAGLIWRIPLERFNPVLFVVAICGAAISVFGMSFTRRI